MIWNNFITKRDYVLVNQSENMERMVSTMLAGRSDILKVNSPRDIVHTAIVNWEHNVLRFFPKQVEVKVDGKRIMRNDAATVIEMKLVMESGVRPSLNEALNKKSRFYRPEYAERDVTGLSKSFTRTVQNVVRDLIKKKDTGSLDDGTAEKESADALAIDSYDHYLRKSLTELQYEAFIHHVNDTEHGMENRRYESALRRAKKKLAANDFLKRLLEN